MNMPSYIILGLFPFLGLGTSPTATAQGPSRDIETSKFTYKEVVQVDSVADSTLFQRAESWYEHEFKTAEFDLKNSVDGTLAHKGSFPVTWSNGKSFTQEMQVGYTVTLNTRTNKYRYSITDFMVTRNTGRVVETVTLETFCDQGIPQLAGSGKFFEPVKKDVLGQIDAYITARIESMRGICSGKIEKDDW